MECSIAIDRGIESKFMLLPVEEKAAVISQGVAIRFSELNKRLFLAQSKIRFFEEKYSIKLSALEESGLPDDAGYEMHEDYIMWHHWTDVSENVRKKIEHLRTIAEYGIYS